MKKGQTAPEFELMDQNDHLIRLSDFEGQKVLLAFFPAAFSPACTDELKGFWENFDAFEDVQILAISVDSKWSLKEFARQLDVKFPLLSDFDRKVSKKYGVLREEGTAERAYFVIDEEGKITFMKVMDEPSELMDVDELLKHI